MNWVSPTSPRSSGLWVMSYICQATATACICRAIVLETRDTQYSANGRWSRSDMGAASATLIEIGGPRLNDGMEELIQTVSDQNTGNGTGGTEDGLKRIAGWGSVAVHAIFQH